MFWRLGHHPTTIIEAFPTSPAGNLVEIARAQNSRLLTIEFAEARKEHRAERHVNSGSECVGATNHLQESFLGQLLDQYAVLGQQPRVVKANSVFEPPP